METNKKVRVRFAPSPTGALHIGGVRTALYNYLFAKKHGGDFILRIEDTDTARTVVGAEEYILNSLKWCGIEPNEGFGCNLSVNDKIILDFLDVVPYKQSERNKKGIYKPFVNELISKGFAYYAFDTDEELKTMKAKMEASGVKNSSYNSMTRTNMKNSLNLSDDEVKSKLNNGEKYVVRFKVERNKEVKFNDIIRGNISVNTNELDDKVLFKSDGMPTYHLANVIDDYLMKISHVIRGEEWLPSAPLHVLLYKALEFELPEFAHLPLILAPDGSKLSKRKAKQYGFSVFPLTWTEEEDGKIFTMNGYKEEGYNSDAFINFLALLGWNPGGDKEVMSLDEMASLFDLSKINKSGARFDVVKAKWFNSTYLRKKDQKELVKFLDTKDTNYSEEKLVEIVKAGLERAEFEKDLNDKVSYFFETPVFEENFKFKNEVEFKIVLKIFLNIFSLESTKKIEWNSENIKKLIHSMCEEVNIKMGKIMPDLRKALCGDKSGPELPFIISILGIDEVLKRLEYIDSITSKQMAL